MKNRPISLAIIVIAFFAVSGCGKKNENPAPVKTNPGGSVGPDVYAAGTTMGTIGTVATYWKNGAETKIADNTKISVANGIVVNGGDLWVFGNAQPPGSNNLVPVYWKNGTPNYITGSAGAV